MNEPKTDQASTDPKILAEARKFGAGMRHPEPVPDFDVKAIYIEVYNQIATPLLRERVTADQAFAELGKSEDTNCPCGNCTVDVDKPILGICNEAEFRRFVAAAISEANARLYVALGNSELDKAETQRRAAFLDVMTRLGLDREKGGIAVHTTKGLITRTRDQSVQGARVEVSGGGLQRLGEILKALTKK